MKHSLLDSSWCDASNGSIFMSLASKDKKIFAFFCFKKFRYILSTINARDMQILPFDASHNDESNKLSFILLQSLDAKIFQFEYFGQNAFFKNFVNFDITNVTTFRWILIVERWNAACSIRQYKTHRMAVFSCL